MENTQLLIDTLMNQLRNNPNTEMINAVLKPLVKTINIINESSEIPPNMQPIDHLLKTLYNNGVNINVNRDDTDKNIICNMMLMCDDWTRYAIAVFSEVCMPNITVGPSR